MYRRKVFKVIILNYGCISVAAATLFIFCDNKHYLTFFLKSIKILYKVFYTLKAISI